MSGFSLHSSSILYSLEGCHWAFPFDILSITVQFSKYFRMLQAHFVYLMPHWLTFHVAACFTIDLLINRFIEYSFLKLLCNLCSHLFSPSPSSNTSLFSVTKKSSEFSKKIFWIICHIFFQCLISLGVIFFHPCVGCIINSLLLPVGLQWIWIHLIFTLSPHSSIGGQ